jgi:hypothetical protein
LFLDLGAEESVRTNELRCRTAELPTENGGEPQEPLWSSPEDKLYEQAAQQPPPKPVGCAQPLRASQRRTEASD